MNAIRVQLFLFLVLLICKEYIIKRKQEPHLVRLWYTVKYFCLRSVPVIINRLHFVVPKWSLTASLVWLIIDVETTRFILHILIYLIFSGVPKYFCGALSHAHYLSSILFAIFRIPELNLQVNIVWVHYTPTPVPPFPEN